MIRGRPLTIVVTVVGVLVSAVLLAGCAQATTTTLTASPTTATAGQAVTLAARVTAATTPTGTVTFRDGAVTIGSAGLSGGTATLTTTSLSTGTHQISASYPAQGGWGASTASAVTVTVQAAASDVSLPVRAAFYYPWFPETWTVNGVHVKYNPLLGYYDSSTQSVIDQHIRALDYGGVKVAIASWWGPSTHSENTRIPLLLQRTQAVGSQLKWTLYYEREGVGDPTVSQIQSDLNYIKSNYASSPSYAHVNGKPVIFVYNSSPNDNTCALADKWSQANATANFYVDLKVFPGYKTCSNQPDSWHQYSPAVAEDNQPGYAFAISPGFYRADEAAARLTRDPARWTQDVADLVASGAPWQLVTTFNEWGEGTAVEAAQEWTSSSGYGTYLDALHNQQ